MLRVLTMKLGCGLALISSIHTPIPAKHSFTCRAHTCPQSKLERVVVSLRFGLSPRHENSGIRRGVFPQVFFFCLFAIRNWVPGTGNLTLFFFFGFCSLA